jgi:hypothetical protein
MARSVPTVHALAWMTKVRQVENSLQSYDNKSTKDTRLVYRRLGLQLL